MIRKVSNVVSSVVSSTVSSAVSDLISSIVSSASNGQAMRVWGQTPSIAASSVDNKNKQYTALRTATC